MTHIAEQYCEEIIQGKRIACKWVILACKRHKKDLKNGKKRGVYFDMEAAQYAIDFMQILDLWEGERAGQPFVLEPWQCFIVWCLFGWKRKDGTRRFNFAYIKIPRKNGKTTFAAAIALFMLIGDVEAAPQVYFAATKKEQSRLPWISAKNMIEKSRHPSLRKAVTVLKYSMSVEALSGKCEYLASDSNKLDGLNPNCVVNDELHAWKGRGLYDVLKSAMQARLNPLMISITTAGFDKFSFCHELEQGMQKILKGTVQQDNTFCMMWGIDEGDDWKDPNSWYKANPNLGVSLREALFRDQFHSAMNNPGEEVNFKTKHLNIWTNASDVWIKDEVWMKCDKGDVMAELEGRKCWGGLDLAAVSDFNFLTLTFPDDEVPENHVQLYFAWCPERKIEERKERVPYDVWARDGLITPTPGNVVDHGWIVKDILELGERYKIQSIAYDRYLSETSNTVQRLVDAGVKMSPFGQGFVSMGEPTKEMERIVYSERLNHMGNPVMRWMVSNVEIKMDPAGAKKIDKGRSQDKVDGPVSAVMAIGEYMTHKINGRPKAGVGVIELD